jgi:hypothetical protein
MGSCVSLAVSSSSSITGWHSLPESSEWLLRSSRGSMSSDGTALLGTWTLMLGLIEAVAVDDDIFENCVSVCRETILVL